MIPASTIIIYHILTLCKGITSLFFQRLSFDKLVNQLIQPPDSTKKM